MCLHVFRSTSGVVRGHLKASWSVRPQPLRPVARPMPEDSGAVFFQLSLAGALLWLLQGSPTWRSAAPSQEVACGCADELQEIVRLQQSLDWWRAGAFLTVGALLLSLTVIAQLVGCLRCCVCPWPRGLGNGRAAHIEILDSRGIRAREVSTAAPRVVAGVGDSPQSRHRGVLRGDPRFRGYL